VPYNLFSSLLIFIIKQTEVSTVTKSTHQAKHPYKGSLNHEISYQTHSTSAQIPIHQASISYHFSYLGPHPTNLNFTPPFIPH